MNTISSVLTTATNPPTAACGLPNVLWTTERFVEEVEQVRKYIGADSSNFYLLGNSWGGILAMEYALKYQHNMKGLLVSNMMASAPEYGRYADEVLAGQMNPEALAEIKAIEAKKDFAKQKGFCQPALHGAVDSQLLQRAYLSFKAMARWFQPCHEACQWRGIYPYAGPK